MISKKVGFFLWVCFWGISLVYAEEGPRVEIFSPQGLVKGIRQVRVRFSEQIVPLDDPRGIVEPFEMICSEKGASRWADGKNWIYDFERDLPAGVRCEFRLKKDLKTLGGKELTGQKVFFFSTGGPSIKASIPHEGSQHINEDQAFVLTYADIRSARRGRAFGCSEA